jgi:hypothetical protein
MIPITPNPPRLTNLSPQPQTLEWEPEEGNFWFVVMNADGSSDVDVDMQIGARIPFLRYIGNMLLAGGFISLVVGGLIIYVGVFRRR